MKRMTSDIHMRLTSYIRRVKGEGMALLESAEDDGFRRGEGGGEFLVASTLPDPICCTDHTCL